MSRRAISHSEITSAYDCQAKHAFAYTGQLTDGVTLKPHAPAARLRAGRAWGRGVAAFHMADAGLTLMARYMTGLRDAMASLDEDAAAMRSHDNPENEDAGTTVRIYNAAEHHDMAIRIADILWHYVTTTEPLTISDPELELRLPIPSRSGVRLSNRYAFEGRLDGIAVLDDRLWLVEYKLRDTLSEFEDIANGQQYRRYVWAAERQLGIRVAGIIVDERLSIAPEPARWVKAKRKGEGLDGRVPSETAKQHTTSASYIEACLDAGVDINQDTVTDLDARRWQKRHKLMFRRSEIDDAGRELVSAAQYIAQLDTGALHPVRNRAPWRCRGCQFKSICNTPDDLDVVRLNFDLTVPKRERTPLLEGSAS